jgi:AraC family transcriptional regulator
MSKNKPLNIDFSREKEAGYQRVYSRLPLLTNLAFSWDGVYFAYDNQPAHETPEVIAPQMGVAIFTQVPEDIEYEQTLDGRLYRKQVVKADIVITPENTATRARWNQTFSTILLGFEPLIFKRTIYEALDPDKVEITPHFAISDPLVYQIGLALKSALENYSMGSRLYAETMANALAVHILQNYSVKKPVIHDYTEGLPRYKLQMVIDYIHAHLNQDIGLTELAQLVQMSSRYFLKLFKASTGVTPHQFVIRTRIELAKELLQAGKMSIAEVAVTVGFASQGHLNLHFKRLLGITPGQFQHK